MVARLLVRWTERILILPLDSGHTTSATQSSLDLRESGFNSADGSWMNRQISCAG